MKRGGRLNPMSAKRRADLPRRRAETAAVLAPGARCVLDGVVAAGRCFGRLTPHHLRKASQGGAHDRDNLVPCCEHHQTWIEDHPDEAHALGLVLRNGE